MMLYSVIGVSISLGDSSGETHRMSERLGGEEVFRSMSFGSSPGVDHRMSDWLDGGDVHGSPSVRDISFVDDGVTGVVFELRRLDWEGDLIAKMTIQLWQSFRLQLQGFY